VLLLAGEAGVAEAVLHGDEVRVVRAEVCSGEAEQGKDARWQRTCGREWSSAARERRMQLPSPTRRGARVRPRFQPPATATAPGSALPGRSGLRQRPWLQSSEPDSRSEEHTSELQARE